MSWEDDFKKFRNHTEKAYSKVWGPRCEMKDVDDFPDLDEKDVSSRCPSCYAYELLDKQLYQLELETKKWFNKER